MLDKYSGSVHLTDLEIILEADAELPRRRARRVRAHLATCWTCRTRKAQLDESISAFVRLYHDRYQQHVPAVECPRRLLQTRLAEARPHTRQSVWRSRLQITPRAFAAVACAFVVVSSILAFSLRNRFPSILGNRLVVHAQLPDYRITPGEASPVSREFVCRAEATESVPIAESMARQVFRRYRLPEPAPGAYEVDYVIPPALGGLRSAGNLWPQPYSHGEWNSHIKDALEQKLESLVCAGKLDVRQAQEDLAKNWIAAYKIYFNSDKPLLDHLAFAKDRPYLAGASELLR